MIWRRYKAWDRERIDNCPPDRFLWKVPFDAGFGSLSGNIQGRKGFVTINLEDLDSSKFSEGEEVSLQTLQEKRVLNISGTDKKLPLKVLGEGELPFPLTIKATAFSEVAKSQIEAAGGTIVEVPKKAKWTRKAAKAAGKSK